MLYGSLSPEICIVILAIISAAKKYCCLVESAKRIGCETRNTFCRTRSLSNATFHFWSRDVHRVQNLLLCTKFHENPMIFHWDMAIYWFTKWRPSAILKMFYHHTRPPTKSMLLAAAACQISCQSDTQIWRYSYLNFSHIWLEMPIQAPKMVFLGDFRPNPKCDYSSSRPPKGTSLRKSYAFFKLNCKHPLRGLTCASWQKVWRTFTHTHTNTHTHR